MSEQNKQELIDERKSNLPLPEQPPKPSDFNSADGRTVNVGSGGVESDISTGDASTTGLRGPATRASGVREEGGADVKSVGMEAKDGK